MQQSRRSWSLKLILSLEQRANKSNSAFGDLVHLGLWRGDIREAVRSVSQVSLGKSSIGHEIGWQHDPFGRRAYLGLSASGEFFPRKNTQKSDPGTPQPQGHNELHYITLQEYCYDWCKFLNKLLLFFFGCARACPVLCREQNLNRKINLHPL